MNISVTYDEMKLLLNALESKVVLIEDIEFGNPDDATPYALLYRKLCLLLNREVDS